MLWEGGFLWLGKRSFLRFSLKYDNEFERGISRLVLDSECSEGLTAKHNAYNYYNQRIQCSLLQNTVASIVRTRWRSCFWTHSRQASCSALTLSILYYFNFTISAGSSPCFLLYGASPLPSKAIPYDPRDWASSLWSRSTKCREQMILLCWVFVGWKFVLKLNLHSIDELLDLMLFHSALDRMVCKCCWLVDWLTGLIFMLLITPWSLGLWDPAGSYLVIKGCLEVCSVVSPM